MKKNEAILLSYKILIATKGKLHTERSVSDIDQLEEQFNISTFNTLKTVLRVGKIELDKVHNKIENELDARVQ